MTVVKRRVHVRHGQWAGMSGWAYCSESQNEWDSVTVQLDRVEQIPAPPDGSALSAARNVNRSRLNRADMSFSQSLHTECLPRLNYTVRILNSDLTVLSDLEALIEHTTHAEADDRAPVSAPPRLK